MPPRVFAVWAKTLRGQLTHEKESANDRPPWPRTNYRLLIHITSCVGETLKLKFAINIYSVSLIRVLSITWETWRLGFFAGKKNSFALKISKRKLQKYIVPLHTDTTKYHMGKVTEALFIVDVHRNW